ncbi:MAG: zinc ribbon domain-containing protein, partial [Oscillospiraceae bacterium]|nr:zinc ribbon domain-containing protein [Oscillospiraceae bacterium]
MASISVIVIVPLLVVCILLIPTLIGIYIYRDAKARHMDAVLWTLVALLVPSFIGLIIYLIIRGNASNLACPRCKKPVSAQYALCPYCGVNLKASCPRCGAPVDGAFCQKCGASVPETHGAPSAEPKKDRKLLGILIAAVLVPIALFVVGVVSIGLLWRA